MIAFRIIGRWLLDSLFSIVLLLFVLLVAYYSLRAVGVLSQGYAWGEMDWNSDGVTSIQKFFESSEIGREQSSGKAGIALIISHIKTD